MNLKNIPSLSIKMLLALLIGGSSMAKAQNESPELIFQSGFEGTTRVVPFHQDANDIVGNDPQLPLSDWEKLQESGAIGNLYVNYTGGDASKRYAKIIPEPGNPSNHVLHFWLNDSWLASENQVKARVQVEFYDIKGGLREFHQSVRVFLHEDFNVLRDYPHPIHWLTLSEFWNKEWWVNGEKYGFRITLGIGKPTAESKELYFILNGEDAGQKEVWNADSSRVKVPIGKWFTMDYYYKEGNKDSGRFYMTIKPEGEPAQVVFDVTNYTHMTRNPAPQGLTGYNPMKLYTSKELVQFVKSHGKTLQIYWDDIQLWKNKKPAGLKTHDFDDAAPFVGGQIFIEPGISAGRIDTLFMRMKENNLTMCRIRMFESYMRTDKGWDFALYDQAFRAAEKYGVRVYATLFPETEKTDIGGWKFPVDEKQKQQFADFIRNLVSHYKSFPALYGWVLINEPGLDKLPDTEFVRQQFAAWGQSHPQKDFKPNGYPVLMDTRKQAFLTDLNSSFLGWVASEVEKYDTTHDVHVNTHAIYQNSAQYDFPAWRQFLTSLGGSAHAAWHFSYFDRQQYALAMLANAEIIRSGAGNLPWFMTELQGGNNTYSGMKAMCPTPEEIAQWLWITLGCEGKGSIFWSFNPRSSGIEAGEWALLTFRDQPSGRLLSAKKTAAAFRDNKQLFSHLKLIPSGIDVLYIRESMWSEQLMAVKDDPYIGRQPGAVMKSAVACFRALTERGLNVGFKEINEYDFTKTDYSGQSIILSNQIAIPARYKEKLESFVKGGGTLLVEGLSAFFDEDLHCTLNTGFMFEELFGGNISEFLLKENLFNLKVNNRELPVHAWEGTIVPRPTGELKTVHENRYGKGRVVWLPSTVALGAWTSGKYTPLSDYLISELPVSPDAFAFDKQYDNLLMRSLRSGDDTVIICINKSGKEQLVRLKNKVIKGKATVLYNSENSRLNETNLQLASEGILVIQVKK